MSDVPDFDYEALRYIELIGGGEKNPKHAWGGYDQDFDEAEHVLTHEEIDDHPATEWGVVDVESPEHTSMTLLIFDVDVHKAPDDFDVSRVGIPEDTLLVRSQSGGFHVYFKANGFQRGDLKESDFPVVKDLPGDFDIDIRGSLVSAHVVAPKEIPGSESGYTVVNDKPIKAVLDPGDAAERITLDGEAILDYDPDSYATDFEFDRPDDAPEDMPACYHAGLQLRKANPDDHPNTHKVNFLTAACGLGAGYDVEEVGSHFINEYAPGASCDTRETEKQLAQMDRVDYAPPTEETLRNFGILESGESCDGDCPIPYHGDSEPAKLDIVKQFEERRDAEAEAAAVAGPEAAEAETAETDGGAAAAETGGSSEPLSDDEAFANDVQQAIVETAEDDEIEQKTCRHRIAEAFMRYYDFVYPEEEVRGWRSTLYVYDADEGVYEARGDNFVEHKLEVTAGDYVTNQVTNEIVGKLERMSIARGDRFRVDPHRLVVSNGILDLHNGEVDAWTPTEFHRTKLDVAWNPDAGEPDAIDGFMHEIVDDSDVATLYRLIAHSIYKEYVGEKAAMLVGAGQNGKSVFLDFVEDFLGGYNVSHRSLQAFKDKFAAEQLEGKLANIHPDMGDESVKDMSTFKKLTGRDTMTADVKFESPVIFENYATLMFAANEMPVFGEDNHAIWRRWVYINFPYTFDETDPEAKEPEPKRVLMRRLTQDQEKEALLVRCQQEIQRWYEGEEWYPDAMRPDEVREQMKKAAEPVYDFATTCLRDVDDETEWLEKDEVRKGYREYATQQSLPKMSGEQFGERLLGLRDFTIENGRPSVDGRRPRVYKGVTWSARGRQLLGLDEPDADDDQATVDQSKSSKRDVLEVVEELVSENDNQPVSRDMVIGRSLSKMGMSAAEYALDELKKQGDVMETDDGVIDT